MANVAARLTTFLKETREEMTQVTWPTREELVGSLLVILVGVALLATFISLCDVVLSTAAKGLLR